MVEYYLESILTSKGLTFSDIELVRLAGAEAIAASSAGHLDTFFGSEGIAFLPGGLPESIASSNIVTDLLGQRQYSLIVFGPKLLEAPLSLGVGYLRAYLRGVRAYAAGDTPRFLLRLAAESGFDPERLKNGCRNTASESGQIEARDLQRVLDWAISKSYVTEPANIEQLVDRRFQQAAAASLETN
jgi:ABC-type nitrate/sulfonate/bicarbonate transport system substrate-binding protein